MQNSNFLTTMRQLRRILPLLGWILLVIVYIVSGMTGGLFLAKLMGNALLAYCISLAIQATRCVIVFFPQMNPNRPSLGYAGEIAALFFGLLSIYEMYSLTTSSSQNLAVFVSVAVLMFAGIVIEVMMLREVRYATESELLNNPEEVQRIATLQINRARLMAQMEAIADEAASGYEKFKGQVFLNAAPPTDPNTELLDKLAELEKVIQEKEQQLHDLALFVGPPSTSEGLIPNGHALGKTSASTTV